MPHVAISVLHPGVENMMAKKLWLLIAVIPALKIILYILRSNVTVVIALFVALNLRQEILFKNYNFCCYYLAYSMCRILRF